jgi:programmed cell death protein 4
MSTFTKAEPLPATKTGDVGTSKRNIIRKNGGGGGSGGSRKANPAGTDTDDGSMTFVSGALDKGDPNYDSEDDGYAGFNHVKPRNTRSWGEAIVGSAKITLPTYKKEIVPIIEEYLGTGEIDEALRRIEAIEAPEYSYEFVKRGINMSLDKNDRERERMSKLLSAGYPDTFSSSTIGKGFERLFEMVDDIEIDAPQCRDMLSTYLARCVVDEVLPPSFLNDAVVRNLGGEIVEYSKRLLSRDHGGAKLEKIWGPGDGRPVQEMKVAVDQLLAEYLVSSDLEEACRCIKEINAPQFFHEIVKRAITMIVDKNEEQQQSMSNLLIFLVEKDMLTQAQTIKGFKRLFDLLGDLMLDAPNAGEVRVLLYYCSSFFSCL